MCSEQPQVHFRIRNRQTGLMMALTGDLDDIKLMRIQEMEENGELDQIWFYRNGRLRCKVAAAAAAAASRHTKTEGFRRFQIKTTARELQRECQTTPA